MNIEVKQHHVELQDSLIENIHRRITADLKRFDHIIRRVCVQITDINGPRGGEDKSCRIQVYRNRASSIVVEDRGASLLAVVGRAVSRVDMAMSRSVEKIRGKRRAKVKVYADPSCTA